MVVQLEFRLSHGRPLFLMTEILLSMILSNQSVMAPRGCVWGTLFGRVLSVSRTRYNRVPFVLMWTRYSERSSAYKDVRTLVKRNMGMHSQKYFRLIITRSFEILIRNFEILIRNFDLLTRNFNFITRNFIQSLLLSGSCNPGYIYRLCTFIVLNSTSLSTYFRSYRTVPACYRVYDIYTYNLFTMLYH